MFRTCWLEKWLRSGLAGHVIDIIKGSREGRPASRDPVPPTGKGGWRAILLFLALAGLLIGSAFFYYRHEQARLQADSIRNLQTAADFKRAQLEEWVARQAYLARVWERGSMVSDLAERWMAAGRLNSRDLARLHERLEAVRASLDAEAVSFIDFTGALRLQTRPHPVHEGLVERTGEVINSRQARWIDFYWHENPGGTVIHLDFLVPLYAHEDDHAIGALLFHFEPAAYLFPLIKKWPTASATAETLLVRREGEQILYLTELRHRSGTALRFSIPLSATAVPAVQAARGITGVVRGNDYRGEPVQAVISSVAGTPWKLIAKIDQREINAPLRREAVQLVVVAAALLLSFAFISRLWWRRQYLEQVARYWESETQRRLLTRRLDYLARYAHDIILLVGADGRLVDVNDRAVSAYGYTRDELIGRPVRELRPLPLEENQTEQMLRSVEHEGRVYEATHRRKNGETFPVEVSARRIKEHGEAFVQEIVRDISERQEAEGQLRLAARVFEGSREGIVVTDAAVRIVAVNDAFTGMTGYSAAEVMGKNPGLLSSGRQDRAYYQDLWDSLQKTGGWEGEIWNRRKDGSIFPEWLSISTVNDEKGRPLNYVGFFTDITERKAAQERLEFLAHHDPLTELPNRALLLDRIDTALAGARRARDRIGVLFLDLDRFKLINDSLGHLVGDQVLCAVAERLQQCLRAEDTLSRIGGDEFVALLNGIREAGDAARVAQKILDRMQEPIIVADHPLTISPSIGIALQDNGSDAERLIQNADAAMYRAKFSGRNNYRFFTPGLNDQALKRLSLENDLRNALDADQFEAHYQPQLDAANGRLIGFEALIRWLHPRHGLILPDQFIPIAEDTGLILPIGERMLDIAARQLANWHSAGLRLQTIAINLSAKQFRCPKLADRLRAILDRHEVPPGCIELELTESALVEPDSALSTVRELKSAGFRLTLDNFGVGYSSLNCLRQYEFDTLKIDQSFVFDLPRDGHDAAIVKAILHVADAIGCQVIAAGVETQAQLDFLVAHGCSRYQGFLASRPIPAREASRFLEEVSLGNAA